MITAPSTVATIVVANSSAASGSMPESATNRVTTSTHPAKAAPAASAASGASCRPRAAATIGQPAEKPLASRLSAQRSAKVCTTCAGSESDTIVSTAEMVIPEAFSVAAAISSGLPAGKLR